MKNVAQQKEIDAKIVNEENKILSQDKDIKINSFKEIIDICLKNKEIKLKYELEKNVNLVKFEKGRMEISFNDNLDKDFVKNLSSKLLEWTNQRWIISFSKSKGEISIKDKDINKKKELIEKAKKSDVYKSIVNYFPDAELTGVKPIKNDD